MYEEIVLLLLLLGNVSTQDLSVNKTNTFLPLTSAKPRRNRTDELPVTEEPGNVSTQDLSVNKTNTFLPLTSPIPRRNRRNEDIPVTEEPDNVSTQDLSVNKTNTFLPLTSAKPRRNRTDELPVTEEPGYNFIPVISQKPPRRSRTAEVLPTEHPGDISTEDPTIHKTYTPLPVTSQKPTTHQRRKETDTVRTNEGYVSGLEEQAVDTTVQGPAHTIEDNIINGHSKTKDQTQESTKYGPKGHIIHKLSGPVITVIVFAVIAGIVGIILLAASLIRRLTTRSNENQPSKTI